VGADNRIGFEHDLFPQRFGVEAFQRAVNYSIGLARFASLMA
jgi:hypothetical protein